MVVPSLDAFNGFGSTKASSNLFGSANASSGVSFIPASATASTAVGYTHRPKWWRCCLGKSPPTRTSRVKQFLATTRVEPRITMDHQSCVVEISPAIPSLHFGSCIFLHGEGTNANGWTGVCHAWASELPHVRFLCPLTLSSPSDLAALMEAEAARVGYEGIVLAGFSQGGAAALRSGLQVEHRLAGIVALSTCVRRSEELSVSLEARSTPVLQCHGDADAVVGLDAVHETREVLSAAGVLSHDVTIFPSVGHTTTDEEIRHVKLWLEQMIPIPETAEEALPP